MAPYSPRPVSQMPFFPSQNTSNSGHSLHWSMLSSLWDPGYETTSLWLNASYHGATDLNTLSQK